MATFETIKSRILNGHYSKVGDARKGIAYAKRLTKGQRKELETLIGKLEKQTDSKIQNGSPVPRMGGKLVENSQWTKVDKAMDLRAHQLELQKGMEAITVRLSQVIVEMNTNELIEYAERLKKLL